MADAKRIVLGGALFYTVLVALLLGTTAVHEYSHYVAHEGFGAAPVAFYSDSDAARDDLVYVQPMDVDGRTYRVENVRETTIVFYEDTLVYAFTLNLAPMFLYEDGTLAATFMHTDAAQTESRVLAQGHQEAGWDSVMGAPLLVAAAGFAVSVLWLAWSRSILSRCFSVGFASELGNNAHHAAEIGLPGTPYTVLAQMLFVAAMVTAIIVSRTYLDSMRAPRRSPTPGGNTTFIRSAAEPTGPPSRTWVKPRFRYARRPTSDRVVAESHRAVRTP